MSAAPEQPTPTKHLERVMDSCPREFYRRLSDGEAATTHCPSCAVTSFPPRERCRDCGQTTGWVSLPRTGRLEAFTTQETALRFAAPAVLALARLGEAVVPGIVDGRYEELRVGDEVEVDPRPEPALGLTLVHYRRTGRSCE